MIMPKPMINAYDTFALLHKNKLYEGQLEEVLITELKAKKILCISDTRDVMIAEGEPTTSIAQTIEKAGLGSELEVTQSDFEEFRSMTPEDDAFVDAPRFGRHLPQNKNQTRREYIKVDARQLDEDLPVEQKYDVVLGRNCICACAGDGRLCGGVDLSLASQQHYLEELTRGEPSILVLTASSAQFFPEFAGDTAAQERKQLLYKEAKANMREACRRLNEISDNPYRYELIEMDRNLKYLMTAPENENGYMLVAYDTRKVTFQVTTHSLKEERAVEREREEGLRSPQMGFFKMSSVDDLKESSVVAPSPSQTSKIKPFN